MHKISGIVIAAASGVLLTGCVHDGKPHGPMESPTVNVPAQLAVTGDRASGFDFHYSAPFADEHGNFDFSQKGADGNIIKLSFTLDGSVPGLRFKPDGREAMWIVEKENVGKDGSPTGPYRGQQFLDFKVSDDGLTLEVTDLNDDGVLYRYGLRFDLDGETVVHDPDAQNGGGFG